MSSGIAPDAGATMSDYTLRVDVGLRVQWMKQPDNTSEKIVREQIQTRLDYLAARVSRRFQDMANEDAKATIVHIEQFLASAIPKDRG